MTLCQEIHPTITESVCLCSCLHCTCFPLLFHYTRHVWCDFPLFPWIYFSWFKIKFTNVIYTVFPCFFGDCSCQQKVVWALGNTFSFYIYILVQCFVGVDWEEEVFLVFWNFLEKHYIYINIYMFLFYTKVKSIFLLKTLDVIS